MCVLTGRLTFDQLFALICQLLLFETSGAFKYIPDIQILLLRVAKYLPVLFICLFLLCFITCLVSIDLVFFFVHFKYNKPDSCKL